MLICANGRVAGSVQRLRSEFGSRFGRRSCFGIATLGFTLTDVRIEPPARLVQIPLRNDVVAIKHRSRLVTGDHHRDSFWNPGPNQISHTGPPQVMKDPRGTAIFVNEARRLARRIPRVPKILDLPAAAGENPRTLWPVLVSCSLLHS